MMGRMKLKILLFAAARQRIGAGSIELEIALPATVSELGSALLQRHPELEGLIATSRWAIDQTFVDRDAVVQGNEEIALIPPVSGG
jgi:molybdopterin converting factor subunit 1